LKPIKAVIRHIPTNTYEENIYEALVDLAFDVTSVKQMITSRQSPSEDPGNSNLPLFLITHPWTE
jgi:hypothetical protein